MKHYKLYIKFGIIKHPDTNDEEFIIVAANDETAKKQAWELIANWNIYENISSAIKRGDISLAEITTRIVNMGDEDVHKRTDR
jgi:hypothetical protein